jgi:hypothetical protein
MALRDSEPAAQAHSAMSGLAGLRRRLCFVMGIRLYPQYLYIPLGAISVKREAKRSATEVAKASHQREPRDAKENRRSACRDCAISMPYGEFSLQMRVLRPCLNGLV